MAADAGGNTPIGPAGARWTLQVLGGFRLTDATGAEIAMPARLDRALLAYLALFQGQRHARPKLATLLWPNRSEALHSLSESLRNLRKALGDSDGKVIAHKADPLVCDLSLMTVDALAFGRSVASGTRESLERAEAIYAGDLLDGFDSRSDEFDRWLAPERERLRDGFIDCLIRLAKLREEAGEFQPAISTAQRVLKLDELQEGAHCALMRLYLKTGHQREARRQAQFCEETLRREVGELQPGTRQAIDRILHASPRQAETPADPAPSPTAVAIPPSAPSIVVLPFANMSDHPEQEYFSDGISEDLITDLSYFREFFVIARNTSFTFKGKAVRVGEVCRELGVRYLLEGSVRKEGNRVRVTARLIDGLTEANLWAGQYDRDLDSIFQVQDEITEAIVTSVAPETLGAESRRSQAKQLDDLSVWEQVLRARWHLNKLTKQDNQAGEKILAGAIEAGPRFAPAHSTLAICRLSNVLHAWSDAIGPTIAAAEDAARTAASLDAGDANALAAWGISCLFAREHENALKRLDRAIRLNPNLAAAHGYLAAVHGCMGNSAAAAAAADKAAKISPLDSAKPLWLAGKGIGAYINGRYEEVVDICHEVLRENPNAGSALRQLAASCAMLGRMQQADEALQQLLCCMPGLTVSKVRDIVPVMAADAQERWLEGLRKAGLPD